MGRLIRWKVKNPYSELKGLIRMSWNKNNLSNLINNQKPMDLSRKSVYQQKWEAKKHLRAYHVPNITERQFMDRHFKTNLPYKLYTKKEKDELPHIESIMFCELERRVDVTVFRSHFAKSIFQARRLVSTGKVKVNGEICKFPARRLEDGDMITVNPKSVPTLKIEGDKSEFQPVPYMSPWMFIPPYLEVCYSTCSTVFLRSPFAQPNEMEIPSPYPPVWHQLAFEWYSTLKRAQTRSEIKPQLIIDQMPVVLKPKFDSIVRSDLKKKQEQKRQERQLQDFLKLEKEKYKYAEQGN
ncbi:mitochondrial 37S ribosomal protein nam9 [Boothiomyces macroporosus]|uniref:Mitochondrial 37S ribosomal protein nam9 n=1 Tax=Boothiomyces macroporosus TaxID=261099 RepID=A0AAD5UDW8_9FUNG|nr:mitochondrial 37S ribosomal protein nam9 [Boothiomyces macroporosus]